MLPTRLTVEILGCPIDRISMLETVELVDRTIASGVSLHYTSVDAGKLALMQGNDELRRNVLASDVIGADGMSLVWLSRWMGAPIPERITGIDLMERLIQRAHEREDAVYLFGATSDVVREVAAVYSRRYGPDVIAGFRDGYFGTREGSAIAEEIAASGAAMLFVGIESPIKERFLSEHDEVLRSVPLRMGVGGAFDVVCGRVKRAPFWVQRAGLEWAYRFMQEPSKWQTEVVDSFAFLRLVAAAALRGRSISEPVHRRG